ncbi:MAG: metal-dependent transcriptional regulator [Thermoanaerobaculia bacterium]
MKHPVGDEILEQLWYRKENGETVQTAADLRLAIPRDELDAALAELERGSFVRREPRIELLAGGEEQARGIVRRHRLAEVLFREVLGTDMADAEESACELEHVLSERVVDRVCTFLGHPPKCPHDLPVPPGTCCRKLDRKVEPLIERLADVEVGSEATIAFIAPGSAARLTRLATLGIAPGGAIRLLQKRPAIVVRSGETSVALDPVIATEIYVRRAAR